MEPNEELSSRLAAALSSLERGQVDAAADDLESLISDGLHSADVYRILGGLRARRERHGEAARWYRAVIDLEPRNREAMSNYLDQRLLAEDLQGLGPLVNELCRVAEHDVRSWVLMARWRFARGDTSGASVALNRGETLDPNFADLHFHRGLVWARLRKLDAAIASFERAIQLDRHHALAWVHLGANLSVRNNYLSGLTHVRKALELKPSNLRIRLRAAMCFIQSGHLDLAETCIEEVLRRRPDDEVGLAWKGNILEKRGQRVEAMECMRPLLRGAKTRPTVAVSYARCAIGSGEVELGLDLVEQVLEMTRGGDATRLLEHLRGECLALLGRYEESMAAHVRANDTMAEDYDPDTFTRFVDDLVAAFPAESFRRRAKARTEATRTVLVVGMPRSGSSLVEQMLSSHSRAIGLGELAELRLAAKMLQKMHGEEDWPEYMDSMTDEQAEVLGDWYRTRAARRVEGLGHEPDRMQAIIDKMPSNFLFLGLAARILPGVRIVHTRRNLLDTCLSCFGQAFVGEGQAFTTRLEWLGRYVRDYQRLMAHWKSVLPDAILDIGYEELVTDPEPVLRRLSTHCGLEWEPRILGFHRNTRFVNTASYHQVQQPLYTHSVNRHEPYLPWLGPLIEILEATD